MCFHLAVDFLADKKLFGAACDGNARNKAYFLLFRPSRLVPDENIPVKEGKRRIIILFPSHHQYRYTEEPSEEPKQKRIKVTSPRIPKKMREPTSPPGHVDLAATQSVVKFDSFEAVAVAKRPTCAVDEGQRIKITHHIQQFMGSEDCVMRSAILASMNKSVSFQDGVNESGLSEVLHYLSEMNSVMLVETDGDVEVYKI